MKEIKDKIDLLRNSISKIENKEYGGLFNQITDILDDLYSSISPDDKSWYLVEIYSWYF